MEKNVYPYWKTAHNLEPCVALWLYSVCKCLHIPSRELHQLEHEPLMPQYTGAGNYTFVSGRGFSLPFCTHLGRRKCFINDDPSPSCSYKINH